MRKLLLAFTLPLVAAALGITVSSPAQAAMSGSGTLYTEQADGTHPHLWQVQYTCNSDGTIAFMFSDDGTDGTPPSGSGSGTLRPADDPNSFALTGANEGYEYSYTGTYADGGEWTSGTATDNQGGTYPGVTGEFTAIPNCTPDQPAYRNHGDCVSQAAKGGEARSTVAKSDCGKEAKTA